MPGTSAARYINFESQLPKNKDPTELNHNTTWDFLEKSGFVRDQWNVQSIQHELAVHLR
jgi:hypothetical protein